MTASPTARSATGRRRDRSLGFPAAEARQAEALASLLRAGVGELILPSPLLPLPAPARRRIGPGRIVSAVLAAVLAFHGAFILATSLLAAAYRIADPPATVLMAYRKWGFGWRIEAPRPLPLKRIPAYVRSMLIAVEDDKFRSHFGLDFEAFRRAREINARLGRPLYGGSTLTMQLARTLFLVPDKSYLRKWLEVIAALELELILGKDRILELYFGYAEWGKGVFGIEAAARRYFGQGLGSLTRDQAARLVALLSSPIRYRPDNLERSGILGERYQYLARRYESGPAEAWRGPAPPLSPEPGAEAGAEAPADAAPGAEPPAAGSPLSSP